MASDALSEVFRPIRRVTLGVAAVLILLVPTTLIVAGRFVWPEIWVWTLLGFGYLYCTIACGNVVRLVKPPASETDVRKVIRSVAWLRLALAGSPGFIALAMTLWLNTAIPYLMMAPLGVLLLLVAYPRGSTMALFQSRLEVSSGR
jgi:hypothetical protein